MIKVSVFYPNTAGCKFDMDYYLTRHMPMVQQKLGGACKRVAVEQGITGGEPEMPAPYVAMGHLYLPRTPRRFLPISPTTLIRSRLFRSARSSCKQRRALGR